MMYQEYWPELIWNNWWVNRGIRPRTAHPHPLLQITRFVCRTISLIHIGKGSLHLHLAYLLSSTWQGGSNRFTGERVFNVRLTFTNDWWSMTDTIYSCTCGCCRDQEANQTNTAIGNGVYQGAHQTDDIRGDLRYGFKGCKPSCLQFFNNPKAALACLCWVSFLQGKTKVVLYCFFALLFSIFKPHNYQITPNEIKSFILSFCIVWKGFM